MHTCTRADLQQKLSGEHIVLSEGDVWPLVLANSLFKKAQGEVNEPATAPQLP